MTTWPGTSIPKSTSNAFNWRAGISPKGETRVCIKCGAIDNQSVARSGAVAWYLTNLSDAEALEVHQFCMAHAPDCFLSAIRSYSEG
mgnify:CR=1 FL=1